MYTLLIRLLTLCIRCSYARIRCSNVSHTLAYASHTVINATLTDHMLLSKFNWSCLKTSNDIEVKYVKYCYGTSKVPFCSNIALH